MKNNKQRNLLARKEKENKKELLSGWTQDKETLLQDDIGIESWFMDEWSSDDDSNRDRRYKCALVESLERRRRQAKERTKITRTPKSITSQNQTTKPECSKSSTAEKRGTQKRVSPEPLTNREPTLSSKSTASLAIQSEKSSDSTSSSVGHVTISQSEPSDTRSDTKWECHSKELSPRRMDSFPISNNSPIVTLLRYEERLKNRRENKLNKRFGNVPRRMEKSDSVSPKKAVTMSSVSFTQGMIQPMSKRTKNRRHHKRTKLPSLETKNENKTEISKMASKLPKEQRNKSIKSADAQECRGNKRETSSAVKDSKKESDTVTKNKTNTQTRIKTMIVNKRKFNFDVLENYALVRNARRDTNFIEYVKMIRKFQSIPGQSSEKELGREKGKNSDFGKTLRRRNSSENFSFDTVRALWHEAQRSRLATHALKERLSLNDKGVESMLMLDVDPRNRSSSEPNGSHSRRNENEVFSCNQKVQFHSGKYTCPLQRILAVTNKRIQANDLFLNQIKNSKHLRISRNEEITESKQVGITKSKTGIHCYIVGRTTPAPEDTL